MASTLVHMSCTQLRNAMVIGMESDSVDESFQGDKRDFEVDEMEQGQVKKRRKQSKPMRIASLESPSDNNEKCGTWTPNGNAEFVNSEEFNTGEEPINVNETTLSFSVKEKTDKLKSDSEELTQGNCVGQFPKTFQNDLSFPLNLSNIKTPSPKNSLESILSEEKNWYKLNNKIPPFQLTPAEPFQIKNQFYTNNVLLPTQTSPLLLPNFKRIVISSSESQIGSPNRIFNPEAFCDLCNKEFCNKYFLKTHRANKHGIYNETIGPTLIENLPTLPIINYFSNSNSAVSLSNPQPVKKTCTITNTSSKPNTGSLRAFCNICQREFCNKYFVRRHKAKIHGIIESNAEESQESKPHLNQEKTEMNDINLPGPSSTKLGKEMVDGIVEESVPKVKKEQDNESEGNASPQTALNLLVSAWQSEDSKDISFSPDRLKRLGVVNNNAFCDICCKEYCNKYFLRTHKQKCHGIVYSDKDEKASGNGHCWKINDPMPLNLILRETSKDQSELDDSGMCSICNVTFPNSHVLKTHYCQVHGEPNKNIRQAQQQPHAFSVFQEKPNKTDVEITKIKTITENNGVILETGHEQHKGSQGEIQKIHSVIMKLNQTGFQENTICEVCNKDLGLPSLLENHILKEHSALLEELSSTLEDDSPNFQFGNTNKYDCLRCQKTFANLSSLEHHLLEYHLDAKNQIRNGGETIDVSGNLSFSGERQSLHTPTSSFCEICKKELCNKYFMKTHMQRMHGISIENGTHIGGVVCDICNKELCSKYFLRVHKQNSHGIVEEAFLPQISSEVKSQNLNSDTSLRPSENDLSHRYFSHFTEVCTICSRRFRSTKWLKAHLLNDHGEEGKDKWKEVQSGNKQGERLFIETGRKNDYPNMFTGSLKNVTSDFELDGGPSTSECSKIEINMNSEKGNEMLTNLLNKSGTRHYQCSYCNFSTPVLPLLFAHEKSHVASLSGAKLYRCPVCMILCESNEILEKHIHSHQAQNDYSNEKITDNINKYKESAKFMHLNHNIEDLEKNIKEDNNIVDVTISQLPVPAVGEVTLKCQKCSYITNHLDLYIDHLRKEHKVIDKNPGSLQILRDALLQVANTSQIPASFATPKNNGNFTMQPFVLEDKALGTNASSAFLSSLVFLPVKERLDKPVTASFKLTPT